MKYGIEKKEKGGKKTLWQKLVRLVRGTSDSMNCKQIEWHGYINGIRNQPSM